MVFAVDMDGLGIPNPRLRLAARVAQLPPALWPRVSVKFVETAHVWSLTRRPASTINICELGDTAALRALAYRRGIGVVFKSRHDG